MKPLLLSFLFCTFVAVSAVAQGPRIFWQRGLGGSYNDQLSSIIATQDGGYLVGGHASSDANDQKSENSRGTFDFWLLKYDSDDRLEWQKTLGGTDWDQLNSMIQTSDEGYLLAGWSYSNASFEKSENRRGDRDYWIVKLSPTGAIEWQKTMGGQGSDVAYAALETANGDFLVGGSSASGQDGDRTAMSRGAEDFWLLRFSAQGALLWQQAYGGSGADALRTIARTTDGTYWLGGSSGSGETGDRSLPNYGGQDFWLVRVNDAGEVIWQYAAGGSEDDRLMGVLAEEGGGLILAGDSKSGATGSKTVESRGESDYWAIRLNENLELDWQQAFGGTQEELLTEAMSTLDGGFILGGHSNSQNTGDKTDTCRGLRDYWLVKVGSEGQIIWQRTIGGDQDEYFDGMAQLPNGALLVGGATNSGVSGDKTEGNRGNADYWLLKLVGEPTGTSASSALAPAAARLVSNPVQQGAANFVLDGASAGQHFSWRWLDVNGRKLTEGNTVAAGSELSVPLPDRCAAGVYTLMLQPETSPALSFKVVLTD